MEHYRVTGLMSGSSMDGTDLACCEFTLENGRWRFEILKAETLPYPPALKKELENLYGSRPQELKEIDLELGHYYARLINEFHEKHMLSPDLISSHGHTLCHDPGNGVTFQAGDGEVILNETGIPVVNDFRSGDVAQGGQGAPLVPVGDMLLFGEYGIRLNLGGIANLSYVDSEGIQRAYDICPANLALNRISGWLFMEYDRNGAVARKGKINKTILDSLNVLPYYRSGPPKSLGREWFRDQFLPLLENGKEAPVDLMATVVEHIALMVSAELNKQEHRTVLVTGGGAFNGFLMERVRCHSQADIHIPENKLVSYKEALVFALLGMLRWRNEINCLASVTGGKRDLSAGVIHVQDRTLLRYRTKP